MLFQIMSHELRIPGNTLWETQCHIMWSSPHFMNDITGWEIKLSFMSEKMEWEGRDDLCEDSQLVTDGAGARGHTSWMLMVMLMKLWHKKVISLCSLFRFPSPGCQSWVSLQSKISPPTKEMFSDSSSLHWSLISLFHTILKDLEKGRKTQKEKKNLFLHFVLKANISHQMGAL